MRILLIGDEIVTPQCLLNFLRKDKLEAEVLFCGSGAAAMDIVAADSAEIVIAHANLSHGDGQALLMQIKNINPDIYTMLITRQRDPVKALKTWVDDCITYPVHVMFRLRKAFAHCTPRLASAQTRTHTWDYDSCQLWEPRAASRKTSKTRKKRGKRASGLMGKLGKVSFALLATVLASIAIFLVFFNVQGRDSLAGYQLYRVVSGSMSPAIKTGSVVLVRSVDPEDIRVGDVITYRGPVTDQLITHRVAEILPGKLSFVTRGDANSVNDPNPIEASQIVGKVDGNIPFLGYLLGVLKTKLGLLLLVFIPGVSLLGYELYNLLRPALQVGRRGRRSRGLGIA